MRRYASGSCSERPTTPRGKSAGTLARASVLGTSALPFRPGSMDTERNRCPGCSTLTSSTTPSSGRSCWPPARSSRSVSTGASPRHPSGWRSRPRRDAGRGRPRRGARVGALGRVPGCGALGGARDAGAVRRHRRGPRRRSRPRGRRDDALPPPAQNAGGGRASLCPRLNPRGTSWSCQDPFTDDSITGVEAAALEADLVGRDAADGGREARDGGQVRGWPRPRSPPVRR